MPYFTQARMRANCELGISDVIRRSELTGASLSS
jgi:hypothetical protein